jgi:ribosomal protein S27E
MMLVVPITSKHKHRDTLMSLQNLMGPVQLQCRRCGNEWTYKGKNPWRVRCTYCGTTVQIRNSRVDIQ